MEKEFKTIKEQIETLKSHGLQFKDEEKATKILLKENYYYLTEEYEDVFMDLKQSRLGEEIYVSETYFEELFAIYQLDRDLRNLIFDYIDLIEKHMESYVSYVFSKKYGCHDYLKKENFSQNPRYEKSIQILFEQIEQNKQKNFANPNSNERKYYETNHVLPLWVLVKVFTFGTITNFYNLMKNEDKQEVADLFSLNFHSVARFLKMLNVVRNICAHGDILFNIRLNQFLAYEDCDDHKRLNIKRVSGGYAQGKNDLFAVLIIIKKLVEPEEFKKAFETIEGFLENTKKELDEESYAKLLDKMGFPQNYQELI